MTNPTHEEVKDLGAEISDQAAEWLHKLIAEVESLRSQLNEARLDRERLASAISDLEPLVNGKHNALSKDTMRFIVRSAIDAARLTQGER